jgi:uncharacterized alkaline shock family protein YloU
MLTLPVWRFGRNRRLVRTLEWLTLCPYCGALPQIAHLLAMVIRPAGGLANCTIGGEVDLRAAEHAHGGPGGGHEQSTQPALRRSRDLGRIEVFPGVVAAIASHAALGCYGVMAMSARGLRDGVAELLRRETAHRGVEVREVDGGLAIDVYVVVQYGTRITEVAHNLQGAVRFEVERTVGVPVSEVNVFVQGVHEDSPQR